MGTKNNPGEFDCYEAADPDEPIFVLLARDPLAPELVRQWANLRSREPKGHNAAQIAKIEEALHCADKMEIWRQNLQRS